MARFQNPVLPCEYVLNSIALDLPSMRGLVGVFSPKRLQRHQRQPSSPQPESRQSLAAKRAFKLQINQADVTPEGYDEFDGTSLGARTTRTRSSKSVHFSSSDDLSSIHGARRDIHLVMDMSMPSAFKI